MAVNRNLWIGEEIVNADKYPIKLPDFGFTFGGSTLSNHMWACMTAGDFDPDTSIGDSSIYYSATPPGYTNGLTFATMHIGTNGGNPYSEFTMTGTFADRSIGNATVYNTLGYDGGASNYPTGMDPSTIIFTANEANKGSSLSTQATKISSTDDVVLTPNAGIAAPRMATPINVFDSGEWSEDFTWSAANKVRSSDVDIPIKRREADGPNGKKIKYFADGGLMPLLEQPFNEIIWVPVVDCFAWYSSKGVTAVETATTLNNAKIAINTNVKRCDLATYLAKYKNSHPNIAAVYAVPFHTKWNEAENRRDVWEAPVYIHRTANTSSTLIQPWSSFPSTPSATPTGMIPLTKLGYELTYEGVNSYDADGNPNSYTNRVAPVATVLWGCYKPSKQVTRDDFFPSLDNANQFYIQLGPGQMYPLIKEWTKYYMFSYYSMDAAATLLDIRTDMANLGMFFRDDSNIKACNKDLTDDKTMCGVMDGFNTTYNYTVGEGNKSNPLYGADSILDRPDDPFNPDDPDPGPGPGPGPTPDPPDTPEPGGASTADGDGMHTGNAGFGYNLGPKHYVITEDEYQKYDAWLTEIMNPDAFNSKLHAQYPDAPDYVKGWETDADYLAFITSQIGYGQDPHNNIISMMAFPFNVVTAYDRVSNIAVGRHTTGDTYKRKIIVTSGGNTTTYTVDYTPSSDNKPEVRPLDDGVKQITMGTYKLDHPLGYKAFTAYEPYSRLELSIPYHGTVQLPLSMWLGKTIKVDALVDLQTGSSLALVLMQGDSGTWMPIYAIPGNMGVSIPLDVNSNMQNTASLIQTAATQKQLETAAANAGYTFLKSAVGGVASAAAGNVGGVGTVLTAGMDLKFSNIQREIQTNATKTAFEYAANGVSIIGTASPATGFRAEACPRLTWHYNNYLSYTESTYANQVGHACYITNNVNQFQGYVVFDSVKLSGILATDYEISQIMDTLTSGVVIEP